MMKAASVMREDNKFGSLQDNQLSATSTAHDLNLWQAFLDLADDRTAPPGSSLSWHEHIVPARAQICLPTTWWDVVPIICSGWAMSSLRLPQGRQQILSFLLPGELMST